MQENLNDTRCIPGDDNDSLSLPSFQIEYEVCLKFVWSGITACRLLIILLSVHLLTNPECLTVFSACQESVCFAIYLSL